MDKQVDELIAKHEQNCDSRKMLPEMCKQLDELHGLFFGTPSRPRNGMIMAIEKNTQFRKAGQWLFGVLLTSLVTGIIALLVRTL